MISKSTLEAVDKGILTDKQLEEAICHYRELANNLECHGDIYKLVRADVCLILKILDGFKTKRSSEINKAMNDSQLEVEIPF